MKKNNNREVALNLNDYLIQCLRTKLDAFAAQYPNSKFNILCDLPKLCRDICLTILHYLWEHQCKGHKTKTAEICCVSRETVRQYENFIEP